MHRAERGKCGANGIGSPSWRTKSVLIQAKQNEENRRSNRTGQGFVHQRGVGVAFDLTYNHTMPGQDRTQHNTRSCWLVCY